MKIYVLSHSYECDVEKTKDEGRFLGVYLTKKEAIEKAEMYKKIKRFLFTYFEFLYKLLYC